MGLVRRAVSSIGWHGSARQGPGIERDPCRGVEETLQKGSSWEWCGALEPSPTELWVSDKVYGVSPSSEHSQVLSRAWFAAVSKNEASGADKTKKPQRTSSFPEDQGELGRQQTVGWC